jgi:tellurite resistance protein TehA-like permease
MADTMADTIMADTQATLVQYPTDATIHVPDSSQPPGQVSPPDPDPEPPRLTAVRNFAASWCLVAQGTGILALLFRQLEYTPPGLQTFSVVLWVLTIVLFVAFLVVYAFRAVCFPKHVLTCLTTDTAEVVCLASIPTTFASIVQVMSLLFGPAGWGAALCVLWWILLAASVLAMLLMPFFFASVNPPGYNLVGPTLQFPIVATVTCAAAGATVVKSTTLDPETGVPIVMVSYMILGLSMPISLILDALFLGRLMHESKASIATAGRTRAFILAAQSMIITGPWGQGSTAMSVLGSVVLDGGLERYNLGVLSNSHAMQAIGYMSILISCFFWAQATFWWIFTLLGISRLFLVREKGQHPITFTIAVWSLVFPWVSFFFPSRQCFGPIISPPN